VSDLSISSSNQIKFDNLSVTLSGGCNKLSASYQAYENKTIIISDFTATTTFICKNDNDKQITDALKNSVSYLQSSDNKITLIDSLNKTTTILSVAPIAKPVTL
jgi:heat shock protein HslJ